MASYIECRTSIVLSVEDRRQLPCGLPSFPADRKIKWISSPHCRRALRRKAERRFRVVPICADGDQHFPEEVGAVFGEK
jgi:hypothetical protein